MIATLKEVSLTFDFTICNKFDSSLLISSRRYTPKAK